MSAQDSRPDDSSPSKAAEAIIDDLKSVIARSISGNLEVAGRVRSLVQALVNTPPSPPATLNPRENVSKLLDFNVASLRVLTEHVLGAINEIVDQAETSLLGERRPRPAAAPNGGAVAAPPAAGAGQAIEIVMSGAIGDRASSPFLIENHYDRDVDVTFEIVAPGAGATPKIPSGALQVEPSRASLPARGQAIVYATVEISESFKPGSSYHGAIRILGFESRPIRVRLDVLAAAPKQTAPKPAAPAGRATAKKARKAAGGRRRAGARKR